MNKEQLAIVENKMRSVGMDLEQIKKECSFALQHINKNKMLKTSSVESQQAAIINVAQVGLTLNPVMKLAYLVPRYNNYTKQNECHLEPSYQGLVKLLTDSGSVQAIQVNLVYETDEFSYRPGDFDNPITHEPDVFAERGELKGAYAIAKLPNGGYQTELMTVKELFEIRDRSDSYKAFKAGKIKSCVWDEFETEMIRKTVLRRIFKYLPKTDRYEQAAKAINLDESDYKASDHQKEYAYQLLENSDVVERTELGAYSHSIDFASSTQISEIINELKARQRDNGRLGMNDINKKVKEITG